MDEMLLQELYGSQEVQAEEEIKQAQVELVEAVAAEAGVDLNELSDDELQKFAHYVLSDEDEEVISDDSDSNYEEKIAEADLMGRQMAHSYLDELNAIQEGEAVQVKVASAMEDVADFWHMQKEAEERDNSARNTAIGATLAGGALAGGAMAGKRIAKSRLGAAQKALGTARAGVGSKGLFGTGVSVALDPRTVGTQIDDSIMEKTISAKILSKDKKYLLAVKTKVLDGRIFVTGKVDSPEEKLMITKLAWETKGARSVRNDIKIKEEFNFKQSAKDVLITSQLRTALIVNKNIKATNYQIDTYKKKIYVYGISLTSEEKDLVISEAKEILDVEDVIASIILVEDLRIQRE